MNWIQEFREKFPFDRFWGSERVHEEVESFIAAKLREAEEKGRRGAVEFIREKFNSDEYYQLFPEDDSEWTEEEHEAGFWMWFNPTLESAARLPEELT